MKNSVVINKKLKLVLLYVLEIWLLDVHPKEMKSLSQRYLSLPCSLINSLIYNTEGMETA